jgi:PEP-CTERM motif
MSDKTRTARQVHFDVTETSWARVSSLPSNVTVISDLATIEADWPGAGNFIPANETVFDVPRELLEVPEDGAYSLDFSFLNKDLPLDGPILADGTLITDPPVPGTSAIPEPATWVMMLLGLSSLALLSTAKARGETV